MLTNHCLCLKILKPSEKKAKYQYGGVNSGRPVTPPRTTQAPKKRWTRSLVILPQLLPLHFQSAFMAIPCNYQVKIQGLSIPTITASSPIHWRLFSSCVCVHKFAVTFFFCLFFFFFFCLLVGILILLTERSVVSLPMPFEVLWDSVLKCLFHGGQRDGLVGIVVELNKSTIWSERLFLFLPWPPVEVESRVFQWGLSFRGIRKSVNTNGILSRFDVTVKNAL